MSTVFFDAHMHAMNLMHPSFTSYIDSVSESFSDFVASGALSPGYILSPQLRGQQGLTTALNMFNIFDRPIGEIFATMEEDLSGAYKSHEYIGVKEKGKASFHYPEKPYIRGGKFSFRDRSYDRYALIPLVMDFSTQSTDEHSRSYYTAESSEKILTYINDTIEGIDWYRSVRPDGILDFYPFLGINPKMHTINFIQDLIEKHVITTKRERHQGRKYFSGIKLYPPLGGDPWPLESIERDKVSLIYEFCSKKRIPIITHCDDQGFRGVNARVAQEFTNPARFKEVLARYPDLIIDFAHYGRQYNPLSKKSLKRLIEGVFTEDSWFTQIISFMREYEHVYADVSFSGSDPLFYSGLNSFMNKLDEGSRQRILERSMFGSDFSVNLTKIESYAAYLSVFHDSPFNDSEVHTIASVNPARFLGLQ